MGKNIRKSFSLVEVTITVFVLGLIMAAVLPVFRKGFLAAESSKNRTVALNLVRGKLEELAFLNTVDPADSGTEDCAVLDPSGKFDGFTRETTVTEESVDVDGDGVLDPGMLSENKVKVSWKNNQFEVVTLEAKY
ncbi:MAG: type II secretion system GspH family protein [Candidatus Omnitrophica bacterium]|nr:type II secretion system GspH family protein [Candidatus Omnitrophota bacterium]MCF7894121.1 type II secretion system GspH family protein [Candidatus Omnitrophota bacterium]